MGGKAQHRMQVALDGLAASRTSLERLDHARMLRTLAEDLERELVHEARGAGLSWTKIGALYGLTKQGAQQRFR